MTRIFANPGLKLVALVLAVVVWFVVSAPRRERVVERAYAAPLALVGIRRDLVITTPVPDTVNVRLRGRSSDLRALSSQNLELTLNLSFAQPGDAHVTLLPQAINVPPEVEVVSIEPDKLAFRVEQLRQKVVPIRPFLVGTPPAGLIAGQPTVSPDQALISGPTSQIRNVAEVATEPIIMTGRPETFSRSAAVVADSPLVRIVEPLNVQVTVPLVATIGPIQPASPDATTDTSTNTRTTTSETPRKQTPAATPRRKPR